MIPESTRSAVRTPGDCADLFEAIPVPATMVDAGGLIVGINQAFVDWAAELGFEVDLAKRLGRPLDAFATSEEQAAQLRDLLSAILTGGEGQRLRESFRDSVGRKISVNVHASALTGPGGEIVGAIVLREDVSEEVHREMRHRLTARVREEVARMTGSVDMERVITAVRDGLQEMAPSSAIAASTWSTTRAIHRSSSSTA